MIPPEFVTPFVVSNGFAIGLLIVAVFWPKVARVLFVVLFLGAGLFNCYTALTEPEAYLMYADFALLPIYRDFIDGLFSQITAPFILAMAAGQLAVSALLAGKGPRLMLGVVGGIVFFVAIAPLGVGSAFPFSVFTIIALVVMHRKLNRQPEASVSHEI
jgi:hypothetical protein